MCCRAINGYAVKRKACLDSARWKMFVILVEGAEEKRTTTPGLGRSCP